MKRLSTLTLYMLVTFQTHASEALRTDIKNCHTIDFAAWSHPTRTVMERAQVRIDRVELCNGDALPIFTVSFKYDPRTVTDSYFIPLYQKMLKANGNWPYVFNDLVDGVSITIERSLSSKEGLAITYGSVISHN